MFEVASKSKPYERVAVAKNFEYVIEAVRAEGTSPWYSAAHDEFVLCMDGEVEVHLVKLADPDAVVDPGERRRAPARRRAGRPEDGAHRAAPGPHGDAAERRGLPLPGGEGLHADDPDHRWAR